MLRKNLWHYQKFKNIKGKTVAIDMDGTICVEKRTFDRPLANPIEGSSGFKLIKKIRIPLFWGLQEDGNRQYKNLVKINSNMTNTRQANVDYFPDDRREIPMENIALLLCELCIIV